MTPPVAEEFEMIVTIPAGQDDREIEKAIRKHRGCKFEAIALGILGTHGRLIIKAANKPAAVALGEKVVKACRLRPGM